ncbi:MAG: leucine-rich repeat domain-containing protein [Clostridia bacterium]|nr:leucine-rich repeat domain-containing protein [Clostridia bacterium]
MKVKTKLIASIMSICLVCAVFAIGVFALRNVTLGIGGTIGFTATGVNATVSGASITGTSDDASVPNLADFSIDTKMNQTQISEKMTSWSNLELSFNDMAEDVVVAFSIKNDSTDEDNFIEVDYEYTLTNASGYNDNVDVFPGADNKYIIYPNTTNDFSLAFRVLDKKMDANIAKIDLKISLKYVDIVYLDENNFDEQGVEYVVGPQGYIIGLAQTHSKNITIPSVVYSEMHQMYQHISLFSGGYFSSDTDLTSITFTNAMESVDLEYCPNVTTVKLGKGVKGLGANAFTNCTSLETISLPNSVTSIGDNAFFGCVALTSVTIPSSVTSIGFCAFSSCSGLTSINVASGNSVYDSRNNCNAIIETASNALIFGCQSTIIPSGITKISDWAFFGCTALASVTIPSSVTEIRESAFGGCEGLTSAKFEVTTNWIHRSSPNSTTGTSVIISSTEFSANAEVLKSSENGLLRTDA